MTRVVLVAIPCGAYAVLTTATGTPHIEAQLVKQLQTFAPATVHVDAVAANA